MVILSCAFAFECFSYATIEEAKSRYSKDEAIAQEKYELSRIAKEEKEREEEAIRRKKEKDKKEKSEKIVSDFCDGLSKYALYFENEGAEVLLNYIASHGSLPDELFKSYRDHHACGIYFGSRSDYKDDFHKFIPSYSDELSNASCPSVLINNGPFKGYYLYANVPWDNYHNPISVYLRKPFWTSSLLGKIMSLIMD